VLDMIQLHEEMVSMLMMAEPGSLRHKAVWSTLELLEAAEAFHREVLVHETATAAGSGSGGGVVLTPPGEARQQQQQRGA